MKTPNSERVHIGFYGRCNSGKSSLINALVGQSVSIVSDIAGTTTDPVKKAMELPGLGAVLLIDTPGLDDKSQLGDQRIKSATDTLSSVDIAILILSGDDSSLEEQFYNELKRRDIKTLVVRNKSDLGQSVASIEGVEPISVSALRGEGIASLRSELAKLSSDEERLLTDWLCKAGDSVMLVMPQDASAPKGRLIQPQVQTIRELLDRGCSPICCTPESMPSALACLKEPPKVIITDSQAFAKVWELKPEASELTSFSILFARYKGDIELFTQGVKVLSKLTEQSRVLIAEACSHAPQGEDIGRVKLPRLLRKRVGEGLKIDIVGGKDFPDDLTPYDLVIHCGACMFNRRLVMSRASMAEAQGVPITNYGVILAALTGILDRVKLC